MIEDSRPTRDAAYLRREDLIEDHSRISSRRNLGAESTALRNGWVSFREILAHQATGGIYDYAQLERRVLAGSIQESELIDPEALGSLGVISVISRGLMVDLDFGLHALQKAIERLPKNRKSYRLRKILAEFYLSRGDRSSVLEMLDLYPDIDRQFYRYLRLDANNPFVFSDTADFSAWLEAFNEPFIDKQLSPVAVESGAQPAFARLAAEPSSVAFATYSAEAPLVSVVMALNNAEGELLLSAVRSILNQTWKNFELLLVFQKSRTRSAEVEALAKADPRIKAVRLTTSQNYYEDLNAGLKQAQGDLITIQAVDDWSHPERIERQIRALETSGEGLAACVGQGILSTRDLTRSLPGREPTFFNPHSLMMTRRTLRAVGGYLPVMAGGAVELQERIERLSGGGVIELALPLTLSLAESEESLTYTSTMEWAHPAYRMFMSSYRHWHREAKPSELSLDDETSPKVFLPSYLKGGEQNAVPQLDVVFAGDWTRFGGPQKSMLEEIKALLGRGYRIGIMTLEAGRFMAKIPRELCVAIQELINSRQVVQVFADEDLSVNLLVLRYPPLLQFIEPKPMAINARRAIILANQAPSELDGSDIRYRIEDCNANAEIFFDCPYKWAPQGPQVREALLQAGLSKDLLTDFDIPGIIDLHEWEVERVGFRGTIPVIGRHSRDDAMKWPDDAEDIRKAYPLDGSLDVRMMGGVKSPLKILERDDIPPGWIVHSADEMPVKTFLGCLDYFVFYQHPRAVEAFGRAILEAIGSGLVVILPPHFEAVFGAGAVYSEVDNVISTVRKYHNDRALYNEQVARARREVQDRFSYEAYRSLVDSLLRTPARHDV